MATKQLIPIPTDLSEIEIARFFAKTRRDENTGCLIWTASGVDGYGYVTIRKKHYRSSRIAWAIHHGSDPGVMCVCHNCPHGDNPRCVAWEHLFLGSNADNSEDMKRKGRQGHGHRLLSTHSKICRGSKIGNSKLIDKQVIDIRRIYATGTITQVGLAKAYGASQPLISAIVLGRLWPHLLPDPSPVSQ